MKTTRAYTEDTAMNEVEHKWWNENADIVSSVWEMHPEISWVVREKYLIRAKDFFLKNKEKVAILELGCGSGWVGQFIAGPNLKIIGSDFSENQIKLAVNNARVKGLNEYCDYLVSNSVNWYKDARNVDGILIHAFMHHLDGKEIENLLTNLKSNLKKGTKVWLYEPAFYLSPASNTAKTSLLSKLCLKISACMLSSLKNIAKNMNLIDIETAERFSGLINQAAKEQWYLSPKEIPFDVDEFSFQLSKYFEITDKYWATIYLVGFASEINLIKYELLRKILAKTILPFFRFTDCRLTKEKAFLEQSLRAPVYAFHVWECIA